MEFDKYYFYRESVQTPDGDVDFFNKVYKELRKKSPKILREDFCGTHAMCCEWVKLDPEYQAFGVDLDLEPIEYGQKNYYSQLNEEHKKRVQVIQTNVLNPELPHADLILATNFSYFIFKTRLKLKEYFQKAYDRLHSEGLFIVDCFGGSLCQEANEEETEHDNFSYFWDQDGFDPITHHAIFHIHFQPKGQSKVKNVFTYDWRIWTIPEIRDLMEEVGFQTTHIYWEGTTEDGEGDGQFIRTSQGEECQSWIAYIVGEK